jgi:pimeloyl-ACP methyl ester carboxylesterase
MPHYAAQPIPIVFVPGLNGDPRIFAQQTAAFPNSMVVTYIEPQPTEELPEYAGRLARSLELSGPCLIAGVSFGGIIALEMARHLETRHCIVIASSRDAAGLPRALRLLRPISGIVPRSLVRSAVDAGWSSDGAVPDVRRTTGRLSAEQRAFQQWALGALLTWRPQGPPTCPVLQIHGDRDGRFPAGASRADRVIPGAGHLLTLTHSDEVNRLLEEVVRASAA